MMKKILSFSLSLAFILALSLPASFGIGFSWGTEKMVEEAIRMDNKGIITEY